MSNLRRKRIEARTRRALEAGRKSLTKREGPPSAREVIQYLRERVSPGPVEPEPEIEEDSIPVSGHFARRGHPDPTAKDEEE